MGNRHYALAFPKGSHLKERVSKQILRYSELGILKNLENVWLNKIQSNCSQEKSGNSESGTVRTLPYREILNFEFSRQKCDSILILLFVDGPFMLLLFAGVTALVIAFAELLFYSVMRSRRASICLPAGGPTGSRGGKACSIIKEELGDVISCKPVKDDSNNVNLAAASFAQQQNMDNNTRHPPNGLYR